ncbi:MAG: GDP-L-fucose synthase [Coriobacteriia bacterium]|nr:GDP-L-fucose synthase [Coriobacteriia bacterium]
MRRDSRIYVAGHRGLVGSAILRRLEAAGHENLLLRTHSELDLTSQAATEAFFASERPEYVFLAAAKVGGIGANSAYPAEFIYENLAIAMNVVEAARVHGVTKLLNLGSSCIYPRLAEQPMTEDALLTGPLEPTNEPYAVAKIAAIKLCSAYNRQYGTDFVSLMPTNLYGVGDDYDTESGHALPALVAKFHEAKVSGRDRVVLWGDGSPRREFLFSDDLADAAVMVMERLSADEVGEFINVGSGEELSIAQLAGLVRDTVYADAAGRECEIVWDTSRPGGTPRKLLDTSRMRAHGWRPSTPLARGLPIAYADYLRRHA